MLKNEARARLDAAQSVRLDDIDRKLLALLSEDATRSYVELGKLVHLSAPAVHERVKRLKQVGVIKTTVAILDPALIGRPLLAFIQVRTKLWEREHPLVELAALPAVEEMHTVTGDVAVIMKVRVRDAQELEELLVRIHRMETIESTSSVMVLSTYLERGPSPHLD